MTRDEFETRSRRRMSIFAREQLLAKLFRNARRRACDFYIFSEIFRKPRRWIIFRIFLIFFGNRCEILGNKCSELVNSRTWNRLESECFGDYFSCTLEVESKSLISIRYSSTNSDSLPSQTDPDLEDSRLSTSFHDFRR